MGALSYHGKVLWYHDQYVMSLPYKDSDNLFHGDPVSWNSDGIEACDDGDVDDVTFAGICLSKLTTGLHTSDNVVEVAPICIYEAILSTAAVVSPGQMFIFGDDGRGTMVTIDAGNHSYGHAIERQASTVSVAKISLNAILMSGTGGHLFEDFAT